MSRSSNEIERVKFLNCTNAMVHDVAICTSSYDPKIESCNIGRSIMCSCLKALTWTRTYNITQQC